jgi:hypothetical protein
MTFGFWVNTIFQYKFTTPKKLEMAHPLNAVI